VLVEHLSSSISNVLSSASNSSCFLYIGQARRQKIRFYPTLHRSAKVPVWPNSESETQATSVLCVFADEIPRVKPHIIFREKGSKTTHIQHQEKTQYDSRVYVSFNDTAYCNEATTLSWINHDLIAAFQQGPGPLALGVVSFHTSPEVKALLKSHDITYS